MTSCARLAFGPPQRRSLTPGGNIPTHHGVLQALMLPPPLVGDLATDRLSDPLKFTPAWQKCRLKGSDHPLSYVRAAPLAIAAPKVPALQSCLNAPHRKRHQRCQRPWWRKKPNSLHILETCILPMLRSPNRRHKSAAIKTRHMPKGCQTYSKYNNET